MDSIGRKIKLRRDELGLTLEEVGQAVGVGKSTVRKWETGDIKNMKRDKISKLAYVLKVSPSFIMDENFEAASARDNIVARLEAGSDIQHIVITQAEYQLLLAYRNAPPEAKAMLDKIAEP